MTAGSRGSEDPARPVRGRLLPAARRDTRAARPATLGQATLEAGDAEAGDAEPVREYLKQVSKVPGLTAEQEAELARQIEAGLAAERKLAEADDRLAASERIDLEWAAEVGTRARKHLLEANLRLVVARGQALHRPRHAAPRPDPGGQPRA